MPPSKHLPPSPAVPPFEPPPLPAADHRFRRAGSCGSSASTARSAAPCCSASRCCSTCAALNVATPNAFVTGDRAVFRLRPRRVLVGAAATAAVAAAADAVRAAGRRRLLPRAGDVRRRHAPARRCRSCCSRSSPPAAGCCARGRRSSTPRSPRSCCSASTRIASSRAIGGAATLFQTGLIGFGYFATVGIAVALGRYTKQSEDLAAQRGIDVANLEQVNRLIIQDMQDGVLVVDLNGVVRGHNAPGDAPARRLRAHARRHAARRVLAPRCTTTGGAARPDVVGSAVNSMPAGTSRQPKPGSPRARSTGNRRRAMTPTRYRWTMPFCTQRREPRERLTAKPSR